MDLSIVIPAYNEALRLPKSLELIRAFLAKQSYSSEIIVVDDGSTDDMVALVKQFDQNIRVVHHQKNRGKGAAVRTGMLAAQGEWRLLTDADLSTPISELNRFWARRNEADILIGSRRAPGARVVTAQAHWKVLLGQLGNFLIQLLVVRGIRDTQCGFKLFHHRTHRIFEVQRLDRFSYDFELLYVARKFRFKILELPVEWHNDIQSKVSTSDYFRTLIDIGRIHWHRWQGHYSNP